MTRPRGSRFLWTGILLPPLLFLAVTGAISMWPRQVLVLTDRLASLFSSEPTNDRRSRPHHGVSPPPRPAPPPTTVIRAEIRKPDGSPYTGTYSIGQINATAPRPGFGGGGSHGGTSHSSVDRGPTVVVHPENDFCWITIDAPGYAPEITGPISTADVMKPDFPNVEITLQEGFPHRVRVVDAEGAPIANAIVRSDLTITPPSARTETSPDEEKGTGTFTAHLGKAVSTDQEGWATFSRVRPETDYEFAVTVYDSMLPDDTVFVRPEPGVDTRITLPRSSAAGVVVDEQGRPSADALLLIAGEFDVRNRQELTHSFERIIAAKADEQGRFLLPSLHKDSAYMIRAEGADDSLGFARDVRASNAEIRIETVKPRMVRGVIDMMRPTWISVMYKVPTGFVNHRRNAGNAESFATQWRTTKLGVDGRFEFPVWDPTQVELKIRNQVTLFPWPPPSEPIKFEVPEPPDKPMNRTIRLQVKLEGSNRPGVPVDGTMTLQTANAPVSALPPEPRRVEIHNGTGTLTSIRPETFWYDFTAIPGRWTIPGRINPSPGDLNPVVDVHVIPIGSLRGRVVGADGSPVESGLNVSLRALTPSPVRQDPKADLGARASAAAPSPRVDDPRAASPRPIQPSTSPIPGAAVLSLLSQSPPNVTTTTDAAGKFEIKSWPIDVPGRLTLTGERSKWLGGPIQVNASDDSSEIKEIQVELPGTTTTEVHLLDPDGRPLPDAPLVVSLIRDREWRRWPAGTTDADGRARIDGLVEGEPDYKLTVDFTKDYQRIVAPLKPGSPLELRAERGRVVAGRIVEAVTGWPIPKVRITIKSTSSGAIVAQIQADDDGRFHISTLPEGTYEIQHMLAVSARHLGMPMPIVPAGSDRPVEIRVAGLNMHDPQPKRPNRP